MLIAFKDRLSFHRMRKLEGIEKPTVKCFYAQKNA